MTNREAVIWLINVTADIGKTEHRDLWHYEQALSEIKEMLESQPERKKGKWIKHIDDLFPAESTLECNVCHREQPITIDDNYCPHCGADMRGEQDV